MKHNLKNRPSWKEFSKKPPESYTVALASFGGLCETWFEGFEKELREMKSNLGKMHRQYPLSVDPHLLHLINELLGEDKPQ